MQSLDDIPQLPPSPCVPIPSSSNSCHPIIYPPVHVDFVPKIKQEFENLKEVEKFYNDYARKAGFSTRSFSSRTNKKGELVRKTYVCYKEGRKQVKDNPATKRRRGITREGCSAKLVVVKKGEGFQVSVFVEGHNHIMTSPGRIHLLPSHRKVTAAQKSLTRQLGEANVPPCQQMSILQLQCGGIENVGFTQRDLYNARRDTRKSIGGHDADMFYGYLKNEQEKNPAFRFKWEVDDEQRLTHCFWADATCRQAYKYFGDVVVFDTTYNTNKYAMVLAPIVGVNHHGQTTVFGCALLSNETTESFEWFFKEWLNAMPAGPPKMIITDQDAAMARAIKQTIPHTTHRLCIWHIMNKFSEKIGGLGWLQYSEQFKNCIWDSETPHEFEARWMDLIQKANLSNNQWLRDMYEIREKWIPAYTKHIFAAGMTSSQRVEGQHAFFKRFVSKENTLLDFVSQFDRALTHIRHNELELDHKDKNEKPELKCNTRMESELSEVYTRTMFYKFQEQLREVLAYAVEKMDENENFSFWKVDRDVNPRLNPGSRSRLVSVEKASNYVGCSCKKFEFEGIPCRHVLAYFNHVHVRQLPERYILPRWMAQVKASRVMMELSATRGMGIGDSSTILRRHGLYQKFPEIADRAAETECNTQLLDGALDSLKAIIFGNATPSQEEEFSGIHPQNQPTFKEPLQVKAKGGGKRLKGGKEKAMEKGLRKCTFCGKKGVKHDKRNCPDRTGCSQDVGLDSQDVGLHDEAIEAYRKRGQIRKILKNHRSGIIFHTTKNDMRLRYVVQKSRQRVFPTCLQKKKAQ